jgi:hypothetical protein
LEGPKHFHDIKANSDISVRFGPLRGNRNFPLSERGHCTALPPTTARHLNAKRPLGDFGTTPQTADGDPPLDEPPPPPKPEDEGKPVLLSDRRVAERYDVSVRTLARWDETAGLGFPPPIYIRDRRYRALAALEAWDRSNARKAATQIKPRGTGGRFNALNRPPG